MDYINDYSGLIRKLKALNVREAIVVIDKNFLNYYGIQEVIDISPTFYKRICEDFNGIGSLYIIRGTECFLIQIMDADKNNHLIFKLKKCGNIIIIDD